MTGREELSIPFDLREGATTSEQDLAISSLDSFLECALRLGGWVREWENNGVLVELSHLLDQFRGKSTANSRQTHQDSGLDIINKTSETLELLSLVVITSEVDLVVSQFVTTIGSNQTLDVCQSFVRDNA